MEKKEGLLYFQYHYLSTFIEEKYFSVLSSTVKQYFGHLILENGLTSFDVPKFLSNKLSDLWHIFLYLDGNKNRWGHLSFT